MPHKVQAFVRSRFKREYSKAALYKKIKAARELYARSHTFALSVDQYRIVDDD